MLNNLFLANPPASGSGGTYWFSRLANANVYFSYVPTIAVDSSLNSYIAGGLTTASGSAAIVKLNPTGSIAWQRFFGVNSGSNFYDVKLDSSGNIYAVGSLNGKAFIVKYNSSGTILWQRTLGSASEGTSALSVAIDSSANVYVAGEISGGTSSMLVAKYNTSGTLQWQRRNTASIGDTLTGIAVDSSGNVYVSGFKLIGIGYYSAFIAKLNTSGTTQWERSFSATSEDVIVRGIAVDSSANVYVCGTRYPPSGQDSLFLAKYNTSGTLQWNRALLATYPRKYGFQPTVQLDNTGNPYVLATIVDLNLASNEDFLVIKYNGSGSLQWQRRLYSDGTEYGGNITLSSDGTIMFLNGISSYIFGSTSQIDGWFTAKLPADGSLTANYGSPNPFTYVSMAYSDSASSLTEGQPSGTLSTASFTSATSTETDAAGSFTSQVTNI